MHFLITGHTGFKGSWLSLLLLEMGHQVSGIALEPEKGSLFELISLEKRLSNDVRLDIKERRTLELQVSSISPDVLIHLAAQPLVRRGYREPVETFETNVTGTLNVLKASSVVDSIKAQLIITTDKVYRVDDRETIFTEAHPLGGDDPYSASKAMADILTQSWMKTNSDKVISIARAGNVIGGGDICEDRLVPDLVRAYSKGIHPNLRYPNSVRPWQHVLDCVYGYFKLIEYMIENKQSDIWNFGPDNEEQVSVSTLVEKMAIALGIEPRWNHVPEKLFKETKFLAIDSTKSKRELNWKNSFTPSEAIIRTAEWYKEIRAGKSPEDVSRKQVQEFLKSASL